jgi:hypothetical protein
MGITDSKMLLMKLSSACSNAEEKGDDQVRDVLSDRQVRSYFISTLTQLIKRQFVDCLAKIWKNLPESSKSRINPLGRKRSRKPPKSKDQKVFLSDNLKSALGGWTDNPRSFFDEGESTDPFGLESCAIAASYETLLDTELRSVKDTIRLRFLKVLFYHLKDRFCVSRLRPNSIEWISQRISAAGLSDDDDTNSISNNVRRWAIVGAKYDALCKDLGEYNAAQDYSYLGNLFRLPSDVTDRL